MYPPARSADEQRRLAILESLRILDTPPEERFDRITRLVARCLGVPVVALNLIDVQRQWTKSCVGGAPGGVTPWEQSLCAHTILQNDVVCIPDTQQDPRFVGNPAICLGDVTLHFYAACPLQAPDGTNVGTLCVCDTTPRTLDAEETQALRDFSALLAQELFTAEVGALLAQQYAAEARTRAIMQTVPDALLTVDVCGRIEACNQAAVELFKLPPEALVGQPAARLFPELDRLLPRLPAHYPHYPEQCMETTAHAASGAVIPVDVRVGTTVVDGSLLYLLVVRDITDRLQAQAALLHAQKLESLGILAGGIAHDFNNLLTAILGNVTLAQLEVGPGNELHYPLAQIEQASLRAADLTRQMLAYAGKGRLVDELVDLHGVVHEVSGLLAASLPRGVTLRVETADEPLVVTGDLRQLQQVVTNLLTNAAEAIGEQPGFITLSLVSREQGQDGGTQPPAGLVKLAVTDSGCGMDSATQERIFEPFFTTKFTGRGLGLAAVQGIVRNHGGQVEVQSAPGQGTRVSVTLPRAARRQEVGAPGMAQRGG